MFRGLNIFFFKWQNPWGQYDKITPFKHDIHGTYFMTYNTEINVGSILGQMLEWGTQDLAVEVQNDSPPPSLSA